MSDKTESLPSLAVLGTGGYVHKPARFDAAMMLKVMGANSGNLIFQYAASKLVSATYRYIGLGGLPYDKPNLFAGAKYLLFPAANHLRLGVDWDHLSRFLSHSRMPLIVLGLGAQAETSSGETETIAALKASETIRRLVDVLKERAALVTVRGAFTQKVCHALGLSDVKVLGCPSAMINPSPELGADLAARLDVLRSGDERIAPGLAAAAPFEIAAQPEKLALERKLVRWAVEHDGAYVQQSGGEAIYRMCSGDAASLDPKERAVIASLLAPDMTPTDFWGYIDRRARIYHDARQWFSELGALNAVIGTRIHGCMAAIGCARPGVLIAHDSRTSELAQTMRIPTLAKDKALSSKSLKAALQAAEFDGLSFDAWRRQTARDYIALFGNLDLKPHADLARIAGASQTKPV